MRIHYVKIIYLQFFFRDYAGGEDIVLIIINQKYNAFSMNFELVYNFIKLN